MDDNLIEEYDLNVSSFVGKIFTDIRNIDDEELIFTTSDGKEYIMHHIQDCCESVYLEDIVGDLNDLLNTPIIEAEERSGDEHPPIYQYEDSYTWTFYRFSTIKGTVVLRWYGYSNGYYSERVYVNRIR